MNSAWRPGAVGLGFSDMVDSLEWVSEFWRDFKIGNSQFLLLIFEAIKFLHWGRFGGQKAERKTAIFGGGR